MATPKPKKSLRINTEAALVTDPFDGRYPSLNDRNKDPEFSPGIYYTDDELRKLFDENNAIITQCNDEQRIHLLTNLFTKRLTDKQISMLHPIIRTNFFGYVNETTAFGEPTEHPAVVAQGLKTPPPHPEAEEEDDEPSGKRKKIKRRTNKRKSKGRRRKTRRTRRKKKVKGRSMRKRRK